MKKLTVLDLFCGAGGFSEGFKQNGLQIEQAIDNWKPATDTHLLNHPESDTVRADLFDMDLDDFVKPDVMIGGPPCTEFSFSNNGGGGDRKEGMKLVLRYLELVAKLKPRYWIMENVPRLLETLPERVRLRKLGLNREGFLEIPTRKILNAADFGAPQKRLRLVSGRYPTPQQTHFEPPEKPSWLTMRTIIETFPNSLSRPRANQSIKDPLYPIRLPAKELADHFMDTTFTRAEAQRNRKQKVAHPFYGKMKFPDDLDRPSRTVMATQFNASRETMAIETKINGKTRFRKPTIRECASLQCFPITYKFVGNETVRYKLVGNAIPVKLSHALAKAISDKTGLTMRSETLLAPA
jgi:DNA (cytosine-5)-methyltransferase 1